MRARLGRVLSDRPRTERGERGGKDTTDRLLHRIEADWDGLVASAGEIAAWDSVSQAVVLLQDSDPHRALSLLRLHRRLPQEWAKGDRRAQDHSLVVQMAARAYAPARYDDQIWTSPRRFDAIAAEVLAAASGPPGRRSLSGRQLGGALLLVMLASTTFDREGVGIQAGQALPAASPDLLTGIADSVHHLLAGLYLGEGVNRERAGDAAGAVGYHLRAADLFRRQRDAASLVGAMDYIADLVATSQIDDLAQVSAWIITYALEVDLVAPRAGARAAQRLIRLVVAHQVQHGTSGEEIQPLWRAAKGRRFAAMLQHGTVGWTWDRRVDDLLDRERTLAAALPAHRPLLQPPGWEAGLDAEDLVTAYTTEYETSPSDTAEGALTNLRRAVERLLVSGLTPEDLPAVDEPASLAAIRSRLDPSTALLLAYVGQW
jgi:hypothetical protein